jgi:hypothetical protein
MTDSESGKGDRVRSYHRPGRRDRPSRIGDRPLTAASGLDLANGRLVLFNFANQDHIGDADKQPVF